MKKVNLLLTLSSLTAVLIILERLSLTTKVILQPYSFLRLHEVLQMSVVVLLSSVISFFLLKVLSNNFESLKSKKGTLLGVLFIIGTYFYATGNGAHEIASYLFNTFCNTKHITTVACGSMFFNNYYFGNILYFVGLFLTNLSLICFEIMKPEKGFTKKDITITLVNSFILALMLFAYAAFDRVLVGLWFTIIAAVITNIILLTAKKNFFSLPFTVYCTLAYTLSAIGSAIVRFHK